MAQHDGVIDNGPGLAVRTDINAVIQALMSNNSGPTEPTVTYAGQLWLDTTVMPDGQLRQRNLGNNAWVDPTFALSASFRTADIGFGVRVSPNRFVWNDKADLSGTDIATLSETGALVVADTLTFAGVAQSSANVVLATTGANNIQFRPNGAADATGEVMITPTGNLNVTGQISTNVQLNATGNIVVGGTGYKPGGGPWADSSDSRIKTVSGDYEGGLEQIKDLHPVRYTFKGNDTNEEPRNTVMLTEEADKSAAVVPYANSPHYQAAADAKEFVGLIAQEVEAVMPGMVSQRAAWIDGVEVTDLRDLDTANLVFALVNAVKELAAKVEALEAAAP